MNDVELILMTSQMIASFVAGDRKTAFGIAEKLVAEGVRQFPAEPDDLTDEGAAAAEAIAAEAARLKDG